MTTPHADRDRSEPYWPPAATRAERHSADCERCYWRGRAEAAEAETERLRAIEADLSDQLHGEQGWIGAAVDLQAEVERLRAQVARVEALVEQWDGATEANEDGYPIHARIMQLNIAELRAALDGPA